MKRIELILMEETADTPRKYSICSETTIGYQIPRRWIDKDLSHSFFDSLKTPGVYILVGKHTDQKESVYVGQSDNVAKRLYEHKGGQDGEKQQGKLFWNECLAFVASGSQLHKGHAEFLELAFYDGVYSANRYILENENRPSERNISEGDRIFCDDFIGDCTLLLSLMGRSVFTPLAIDAEQEILGSSDKLSICNSDRRAPSDPRYVNASGYLCQSAEYPNGFMVLENSIIAKEVTKKANPYIKKMRRELTKRGYLREENGMLLIKKEYLFPSPGIAASVVLGRNAVAKDWK